MSLSPEERREDADEEIEEQPTAGGDEGGEQTPDIEEELFEEELRIDGICGVY